MSRFCFCNCPAGFSADPERHAPDCPGRSGAGKPRISQPVTVNIEPTVVELQATIARLTAEIEDWKQGSQVEADAGDEARREARKLRSENERLKGGQGEPVAWQFYQCGKWWNGQETNNHRANTEGAGYPVRDLYTSQPAPVSVGLPLREMFHGEMDSPEVDFNKGWNACLDKVKELNQ